MDLYIAPVKLKLQSDERIRFELLPSAGYLSPIIQPSLEFMCCFNVSEHTPSLEAYKPEFAGKSTDNLLMPYNWFIYTNNATIAIKIEYIIPNFADRVLAIITPSEKRIDIWIQTKSNETIVIDPLFQPLGSLLMVYLAHFSGGFLIHASGVSHEDKNYIFTAVSGTGKSTMAKIWKESGATVCNDDRLWIHKTDGRWHMFNTPMVFYSQPPLAYPIDKIFLIRQSPVNEISKIEGVKGSMRVMANCIQHLFNKEMSAQHLDKLIDFTSQVPVYDLGFKPDNEIVDLIRKLS